MFKVIKSVLVVFLVGYVFFVLDAYVIGWNKSDEKVLEYSFTRSRGRGSADRYWMITEKGKINVPYSLYATLKPGKVVQTYRSKVFGNVLKVNSRADDPLSAHEVCFTRTKSGLALISLFFLVTLISVIRIDRVYRNGRIGLTILLVLLFLITVSVHFY